MAVGQSYAPISVEGLDATLAEAKILLTIARAVRTILENSGEGEAVDENTITMEVLLDDIQRIEQLINMLGYDIFLDPTAISRDFRVSLSKADDKA